MTVQQKLLNVLVIGDACTDAYVYTKNTRVNPEASALLVSATEYETFCGMAGNVANCFSNLGVRVNLFVPPIDQWGYKLRYVDSTSLVQLLRVDSEKKVEPFDNYVVDLDKYDAVVISDYNKGFVTYDTIHWFCDNYEGPIFLDTKKKDITKYSRCFIKINEHEANALDYVAPNIIVTMGANGAIWYNEKWPALETNLVDVCGAGDAFLAGLVYGHLSNETSMIEYGIVNAGVSVGHVGPYAPSLKELFKGLDEYDLQCRQG